MAVPKRFKFKTIKKNSRIIHNNSKFINSWKNKYILNLLKINKDVILIKIFYLFIVNHFSYIKF